jgi:glutamate/tyrosine decarboxylase-like PLP-dependent enzyme
MECVGHGSDSVVWIPQNEDGSMNIESLRKQLQEDKEAGITLLAIVGE